MAISGRLRSKLLAECDSNVNKLAVNVISRFRWFEVRQELRIVGEGIRSPADTMKAAARIEAFLQREARMGHA